MPDLQETPQLSFDKVLGLDLQHRIEYHNHVHRGASPVTIQVASMNGLNALNVPPCPRRDFLQRVITGMGALTLPNILQLRETAAAATQRSDTSLILLWQDGGPSQLETFDPKPDAPSEVRGQFDAISTRHPGIQFCEHLPRLAAMSDKFTTVRTVRQASSSHVSATHTFITGYDRTGVIKGPPRNPDVGAVIHHRRAGQNVQLPDYVALGDGRRGYVGLHRGGTSYLGQSFAPFNVRGDPSDPEFQIKAFEPHAGDHPQRLHERARITEQLDRWRREMDCSTKLDTMQRFQQQAVNLLTGEAAGRAFDLSLEEPRIRKRYGNFLAGQQLLMARRLVEAGVSVVVVRFIPVGDKTKHKKLQEHNSWDDHSESVNIFDISRQRDPQMDHAVSALFEDLGNRGLDKKVLVVLAGEFGRSPRIENQAGRPGRGHWGAASSVLFYGGGFNMGQVIGSTDKHAGHPVDRALKPQDVLATIYHHLGIDPHYQFLDNLGRPHLVLPHGEPIEELV